jgi:hypothetical protein
VAMKQIYVLWVNSLIFPNVDALTPVMVLEVCNFIHSVMLLLVSKCHARVTNSMEQSPT